VSRVLVRASALTGASLTQVVALAVLSLITARYLRVEEFGITRVVSAYMVFLTLVGHFCMQDAATTFVATAPDEREKGRVIVAATALVAVIGVAVALCTDLVVLWSGYWHGSLRRTLAIVAACIPLVSLTVVYTSVLQATGSYRQLAANLALGGLLPLGVIVPAVMFRGLGGWIAGRIVSYVALLVVAALCVAPFLPAAGSIGGLRSTALRLFRYARVQLLSGVLSMALQSADIIALERIGANLREVAVYGLAALFTRPLAMIPAAFGPVLFREIATADRQSRVAATRLLRWTLASCGVIAAALAVVVPMVIRFAYGPNYQAAIPVAEVLLAGVVFNGLWTALSTINVAMQHPDRAVMISASGAGVAAVALPVLIPRFGALGAAWAMNLAYAGGVAVGLWQLYGPQRSVTPHLSQKRLEDSV
jgi:O-antigen/teichoic acid export membrane protein